MDLTIQREVAFVSHRGRGRVSRLFAQVSVQLRVTQSTVTRTQDTPTEKTPPTPAHTRARQEKKKKKRTPPTST